jgi:hypothetical protein
VTGEHRESVSTSANLAAETLGRAGGALFAAAFGLTARLRRTRALHPVGVCGAGTLSVTPGPRSGVVLLDDPGPHPCLVRWSRATGRRQGRDLEGIAVRIDGPAAGDVLFASTGTGTVGRHVLTVRDRHDHGPVTTLLPLSTPRGPLLLRLDPAPAPSRTAGEGPCAAPEPTPQKGAAVDDPPTAYRLFVAAPGQRWHERGRLKITWTDRDCTRRHDPVGHPTAGTWTHPMWARLRDPAYAASQQVAARTIEPKEQS